MNKDQINETIERILAKQNIELILLAFARGIKMPKPKMEVGMPVLQTPDYQGNKGWAFEAATRVGLFGQQSDGTDVVLYYSDHMWQVCVVHWKDEELVPISTDERLPLAVCQAIIVRFGEQEHV